MAVTLSSSTKQPAKPKISHWRFRLESAIARVIAEGKVRTYDMGGKDSTLDVAKAIADYAG
jgi:isocitrate/isopropylmalate dehydrogenase